MGDIGIRTRCTSPAEAIGGPGLMPPYDLETETDGPLPDMGAEAADSPRLRVLQESVNYILTT